MTMQHTFGCEFVVLSGNSFKYEIEAVVKLFFPAMHFNFSNNISDVNAQDEHLNYCVARLRKGKAYTYIYAYAKMSGRYVRIADKCKNAVNDYQKHCERLLCNALYHCLVRQTQITPSWGTMTGIRPIKRVNKLLEEGLCKSDIFKSLSETFLISTEKLELAYSTALVQQPLLTVPKQSFSLYVSIPFCPSRCSYCSFVSHSIEGAAKLIPEYINKLCEELLVVANISDKLGLCLDTVYFGGGTPTVISAEQISVIINTIKKNFTLSSVREYTVEAGRADTITAEKLLAIKENGSSVNTRISINPQTMNNSVLSAIGRRHTAEQTVETFNLARSLGFDNINMDLIAGLPTDTIESFKDTIDHIVQLDPDSVTIHTLSLKRSSALFSQVDSFEEVSRELQVCDMIAYGNSVLSDHYFRPYYLYRQKNTLGNLENVGYAKVGKESLYNIFIMEEIQSILAVGAAASTKLVNVKTGRIERVFNYKFPYEYIDRFSLLMDKKKDIFNFYKTIIKE